MIVNASETGTIAAGDGTAVNYAAQFEQRIVTKARGRIYGLEVNFTDGQLVLTGRCRTYHDKQLAQEAVLRFTEPSTQVVNKIVVS
jgi:hypothetical protein